MKRLFYIFSLAIVFTCLQSKADDGYRLWLRYDLIPDPRALLSFQRLISGGCSTDRGNRDISKLEIVRSLSVTLCYFRVSLCKFLSKIITQSSTEEAQRDTEKNIK
jgi:hypothetical protein